MGNIENIHSKRLQYNIMYGQGRWHLGSVISINTIALSLLSLSLIVVLSSIWIMDKKILEPHLKIQPSLRPLFVF
jgi:hypothetical protein